MIDEQNKCTLSDENLCEKAQYWISKLLDSNGNAWCLSIPVDLNHDPDVVFDELINRVKARAESAAKIQALRDENRRVVERFRQCAEKAAFELSEPPGHEVEVLHMICDEYEAIVESQDEGD